MTEADLPAAMALKAAAGWNQTEDDWRLLLRLQPDGCFVLESKTGVAASATAFCYSQRLSWIGMVLTLPEFRGRGYGSSVFSAALDFCRARTACVKLDATDMGRPLYERAGFVAEYEVDRWLGTAGEPPAHGNERPSGPRLKPAAADEREPSLHRAAAEAGRAPAAVVELTEERLSSLLPFDAAVFGAARGHLLCALLGSACWSACVVEEARPVAYALARPGANAFYFGPCVAEEAAQAAVLLNAFLAAHPGQRAFVNVPAPNAGARTLLARAGFSVCRRLVRMYYGRNDCAGNPSQVFGLAGFEYG